MFEYQIDENEIKIQDDYAGSYTHLWVDYEIHGITQYIAGTFLASLCDHVRYVREAGEKIGVDLAQLKAHDASKFSLEEFPYYARNFHGDKGDPDGFARAWLHHIQYGGEHHWQHWIFPDGFTPKGSSVESGVVEMPYHFAKEMIADWMGASIAYTGSFDMTNWLQNNMPKIRVHSKTAVYLRQELDMLGYADIVYRQKFAQEL